MPGVVETYIGAERRRELVAPSSDETLGALREQREELLDQLAVIRSAERPEAPRHGHELLGQLKQTNDSLKNELQQRADVLASEVRERQMWHQTNPQSEVAGERYRASLQRQAAVAREIHELLPPVRGNEQGLPVDVRTLQGQLTTYAESFSRPCAEAQMARKLADQIGTGVTHIDLSQRYLTADPATALARHEKALQKLDPFVQEAQRLGCSIHAGEAIAASMRQAQTLAVAGGFGA